MARQLIDTFGRVHRDLRISVTDRCNFRCTYCMPAEGLVWLPREELLTFEEIERVARLMVERHGVDSIRLTGGEPTVRANLSTLVGMLADLPGDLTMTTNGVTLRALAGDLAAAGRKRINISLDSLHADRFVELTRRDNLGRVLDGIDAAIEAGLDPVKVNVGVMRGVNDDEIGDFVVWCGDRGFDLTFIEVMPMGEIAGYRPEQFLPLTAVRDRIEERWTLTDTDYRTGGPARYTTVAETGRRGGFITPHSHNFCESCNRVRLTCTGTLYMCLGQNDAADLRAALRAGPSAAPLEAAIDEAIARKPKGHDLVIERAAPAVARHMSVTGG